MKYTKFKNGAYNIHLINTDKFKTISIRVNFKRKVNKGWKFKDVNRWKT